MKYRFSYPTDSGPVWWDCNDDELPEVLRAAADDERRTGVIKAFVTGTTVTPPSPRPQLFPITRPIYPSQLRFDVV